MSIIKDGKQYNVETKLIVSDEFQDQLFSQTLEEIHSTTPVKYGYNMFKNQPKLKVADIVLSDIINTDYQYGSMFENCVALTQAPTLPATTLASDCYSYMFQGCTSLTKAPDLPATTLASTCYYFMFRDCSSLQKTGKIAATGNISDNVPYMFYDCTSLKEMTWTATTPPTISRYIWMNCPEDMKIYVPDESVELYKAASVWSSRAAYILPMSERPE